jgi:xanthine dehydrogenase accessory factor
MDEQPTGGSAGSAEAGSDPACEIAHSDGPPEIPDRVLVAVYASPVATALLRLGAEVGYQPVLVEPDPRVEDPNRAPGGAVRVTSIRDLDDDVLRRADVVVCDHHREDLGVLLRDALARPTRWIGIMGSPRHEAPHPAALAALGVPADQVARVHRPIGLDIGSRTPQEIAVSTVAGLLADRNGRPGGVYERTWAVPRTG